MENIIKIKRFVFGDKIEVKNRKAIEDLSGSNAFVYVLAGDTEEFFQIVEDKELVKWFIPNEEFDEDLIAGKLLLDGNYHSISYHTKEIDFTIEVEINKSEYPLYDGTMNVYKQLYLHVGDEYFKHNHRGTEFMTSTKSLGYYLTKENYKRTRIPLSIDCIDYTKYIYNIVNIMDNSIVGYIDMFKNILIIDGENISKLNFKNPNEYIEYCLYKLYKCVESYINKPMTIQSIFGSIIMKSGLGIREQKECDFARFRLKNVIPLTRKANRVKNKLVPDTSDILGVLLVGREYSMFGMPPCQVGYGLMDAYYLFDMEHFKQFEDIISFDKTKLTIKSNPTESEYTLCVGEDGKVGYINDSGDFLQVIESSGIKLGLNADVEGIAILSFLKDKLKDKVSVELLISDDYKVGYYFTLADENYAIDRETIMNLGYNINENIKPIQVFSSYNDYYEKDTDKEIIFIKGYKTLCKQLLNTI